MSLAALPLCRFLRLPYSWRFRCPHTDNGQSPVQLSYDELQALPT
jgi:hypothetical protein